MDARRCREFHCPLFFFSSYEGDRKEAVPLLVAIEYRAPILSKETNEIN